MIREAKPADIQAILDIERESFPHPWTEEMFVSEFEKKNCDFFVYEISGQVAGYIIFWYIFEEAEVGVVAVSAKHRKKGIASKLLDECIKTHPEVRVIYLEVDKTNTGAICLYEKYGFKKTGYIKDYYGNGADALRMACELPDNNEGCCKC